MANKTVSTTISAQSAVHTTRTQTSTVSQAHKEIVDKNDPPVRRAVTGYRIRPGPPYKAIQEIDGETPLSDDPLLELEHAPRSYAQAVSPTITTPTESTGSSPVGETADSKTMLALSAQFQLVLHDSSQLRLEMDSFRRETNAKMAEMKKDMDEQRVAVCAVLETDRGVVNALLARQALTVTRDYMAYRLFNVRSWHGYWASQKTPEFEEQLARTDKAIRKRIDDAVARGDSTSMVEWTQLEDLFSKLKTAYARARSNDLERVSHPTLTQATLQQVVTSYAPRVGMRAEECAAIQAMLMTSQSGREFVAHVN